MNYPTHRLSLADRTTRDALIGHFLLSGYPHKVIALRLDVSPFIIKEVARRLRTKTDRTASRNYMDSGDIT